MKKLQAAAVVGVGAIGAIWLLNASWLAKPPTGRVEVLAHRGVHQTFPQAGLTRDACTATRINPPTNPYLENTIPSMKASFAVGADALELDVHPTTDGEFAVFHDWTLECRTDGKGVTRQQTMAYLKTLDVGYGYTADHGATYPFRGKGVGMMPTLHEVLTAFPGKSFLINTKSRDPTEGPRLFAYLKAHGHPTDQRLWVVGDQMVLGPLTKLAPTARIAPPSRAKACTKGYLLWGWSGHVPAACHNGTLGIPINYAWAFWGWPNRLLTRMEAVNADVMLVAPYHRGDPGVSGFTNAKQLEAVPQGVTGILLTDNIETVGPAAHRRWPAPSPHPNPSPSRGGAL